MSAMLHLLGILDGSRFFPLGFLFDIHFKLIHIEIFHDFHFSAKMSVFQGHRENNIKFNSIAAEKKDVFQVIGY